MLEAIIKPNVRKPSIAKRVLNFINDYWYTHCLVKKQSHKKRIKSAKKVFKTINQLDFVESPAKLFAYLRKIDPFVFEELLLLAFKKRGFKVIRNQRYTGDGGIDGIVVLPNQQKIAIQAKRYQAHINPKHVQDFQQDLRHKGCDGGFFIHCGKTGQQSYRNLSPNIKLISGLKLHALLIFEPV